MPDFPDGVKAFVNERQKERLTGRIHPRPNGHIDGPSSSPLRNSTNSRYKSPFLRPNPPHVMTQGNRVKSEVVFNIIESTFYSQYITLTRYHNPCGNGLFCLSRDWLWSWASATDGWVVFMTLEIQFNLKLAPNKGTS